MAKLCACTSGRRYVACCAPFHRGAEAPTCEALMRSRFSAFALGLGPYLVRTLARQHEDRVLPDADLARALGKARATQRFLGLHVLFAREADDTGEVLFHARIFERGEDRSFSELSTFVREDGAWRYASGVSLPAAELPPAPRGGGEATRLDREGFLALVDLRELRAGHATDDEIEGLLERVYVGGGFTEPGRAAAQFRGPAVRARGEILAVRAPGGDLAGMAVVVHPASPGRRIARPDEAELQLLAVDAVHRGHGTGERLVRAAIAAARQRGLARLVLWTRPVMRDARRLYDRLGFVPEPDRDFERDGRAFVVLVAEL